MNNKQNRFLTWSTLLLAFVLVCLTLVVNGNTAVASPDINPDWNDAIAITNTSNSPFGATLPIVRSSPDGKTIMIVFNSRFSGDAGDNNPYFSRSTDNGVTWSTPAAIHTSAVKSRHVHLDYDANGVAHVVWQENLGLAYANEGSKNAGLWTDPYVELVAPPADPGVNNPYIVTSGSTRIDIVWAEGNSSPRNIRHTRSNNGGSNWSTSNIPPNTVLDSGWDSEFPSMVVEDETGIVHLVWQEPYDFFAPTKGSIVYSQGTENGNSMNWSPPVTVSTVDVTGNPVGDSREPEIALVNNTLQVVYTDYRANDDQYIKHTQCAGNCTNASSWQATNSPISIQVSGANGSDPLNLVSAVIEWRKCTVSYFHGTSTDFVGENEIIWGVDSCTNWDDSPRDKVTSETVRSLNPSLSTQGNWWLYLVYEQGTGLNPRQIYFQRTKPDIYLPIAFKVN